MNRPKIVAGNWKMNKTLAEAVALADAIIKNTEAVDEVQKILFPPYPCISEVNKIIKTKANFYTGAQNCSEHISGAYTGEVSAAMVKSIGCNYVLVGHSERRQYFNETVEQLEMKMKLAFENNLSPVFCFGEKLNERKNNSHFEVVKKQLKDVLTIFNINQIEKTILAYEPVWAIGTGETATAQQAQEMHAFIRKTIAELFDDDVAKNIPILYGGSCNAKNAKELFACADVDGGLIGGASLNAEDFCKIIYSF